MSFPYDPTLPVPTNDPADDVSGMQTNSGSISSLVAVDHQGFNTATGGTHKQVTYSSNNIPSLPTANPTSFTALPTSFGGSPTYAQEFFYSGTQAQSQDQYVLAGTGSVLLSGGIILKWGQIAAAFNGTTYTFSTLGSSAFPNNIFSVQVTQNIASTQVLIGTNGFTQTGFTFKASVGTGIPISYLAIGN